MIANETGHDQQVIRYIRSWWELHPDWLSALDTVDELDEIHAMRLDLFDRVNAATEGDLATIVQRDSLDWMYLVGAAVAADTQERRRT